MSCPSALAHADAKPFVHPGMLQSRSDLDFMKQRVLANEQPWKGAWDRLLAKKTSSLDFHPQPAAHVIRGAYGKPSIGSNELIASADAAYSHALQWYVTRDKRHAERVFEIIDAWGPVLTDFQLNDAKLLAGWTGHEILNAAEIVRYSDSGWSDKETENLRRMILGVYHPLIKDFFPDANGNWDAAIMDTMLCTGIFFDDHAIFDRAVDHYLHGHLNGGITHYVYPSGQCQETTRDQGHVQLGLGEMAQCCQVAWTQGVDLYGAADNRLALGFEYTAKFNLGNDVPCEGTASDIARNKLSDIYCLVDQHYHFDQGIAMPFTQQAAEKTLPRSQSVLTSYRGEAFGSKPAGHVELVAGKVDGGAKVPGTDPLPDGIVLKPGEPIQPALDQAAAKLHRVLLQDGIYKLDVALRVPSGVTLSGHGPATVLWLDPHVTGPAIVNKDADAHDVAIVQLVIEGATATERHPDPNSDRRTRSRPGAPDRAGIVFAGDEHNALHHIRLVHVTVRNCTQTGVSISNANHIQLCYSSFTDNGNRPSSHNVDLQNVTHLETADCRFNNSPAGCGVSASNCNGLWFTTDEFARNVLQGIQITRCTDVRFWNELIEGNEAGGITAARDCNSITVRQSVFQNNKSATDLRGVAKADLDANVFRANEADRVR